MPETSGERLFQQSLARYHDAHGRVDRPPTDDRLIAIVDDALDALLAVPSPSVAAFGTKLRILEAEYGLDAQPRHVGAIYADVRTWSGT